MGKVNLTVVTATYKSNLFLKNFLESIAKQNLVPGEVVLYDNNSPKSPKKYFVSFSDKYPEIKTEFMEGKENVGFSAAVNSAIEKASNELVLLINPDLVLDKNAIKNLFVLYNKKKFKERVIIGGRSLDWKGQRIIKTVVKEPRACSLLFEFTSLKKVFPNCCFSNDFWNDRVLKTKEPVSVFGVSGNFLMFQKKDFYEIGKFDDKYFLYLEDFDFCLRAKRKGYKIYYVPSAKVEHFHGGSSRNKKGKINNLAWNESKKYFVKKWFGFRGQILNLIFVIDNLLLSIFKKIR